MDLTFTPSAWRRYNEPMTQHGEAHKPDEKKGELIDFPQKKIKRTPEQVQRLKIEEALRRDPLMQHTRIPIILDKLSQLKWHKNVERMDTVRDELPTGLSKLGELIRDSDMEAWKEDPLYFWVLCSTYLEKKKEQRIQEASESA